MDGNFTEGSNWLQAKRYKIWAFCGEKEVKVKETWLLKGKEQSIVEAFHQLSQREHELDACVKTYVTEQPVNAVAISLIFYHVVIGDGQSASDITTTDRCARKFEADGEGTFGRVLKCWDREAR